MPRRYNALNDIKINYYEIGMCPLCCRRLTAGKCPPEHITPEYIKWQAVYFAVEQEVYNEQQAEPVEELLDPPTTAAISHEWGAVSDAYKQAQPYTNPEEVYRF